MAEATGLRVSGIAAKDGKYGVHLHQGTCDASNFDAAGKHYNVSWNNTTTADDLVSNKTGLAGPQCGVRWRRPVNSDSVLHPGGEAVNRAPCSTDSARARGTNGIGYAGPRLACLPFDIETT